MTSIRQDVEDLFSVAIGELDFPVYFQKIYELGKISSTRRLSDLSVIILNKLEAMEKREQEVAQNFKEIESILSRLIEQKNATPKVEPITPVEEPDRSLFTCDVCDKVSANAAGLAAHKRSHKTE